MVWDLDTPADNDKIRVVDDYIREMKRDIELALQEEHSFPVNSASPVCYHSLPSGNTAARPSAGNEGRWYINTQTGTIQRDNGEGWDDITEPDPFPSGSDCLFRQNTAPTFWTRLNENDDRMIRIVSGAGGGTGGAYGFTIPSESFPHNHNGTTVNSVSITNGTLYVPAQKCGAYDNQNYPAIVSPQTFSWGSSVHFHTIPTDNFTHGHYIAATTFKPKYIDMILARKN